MLDPKLLRNEIELVAERLQVRGYSLDVARIQDLEAQRKDTQVQTQALQNQRNQASKAIGQAKAKGEPVDAIMAQTKALGEQLAQAEAALEKLINELDAIYASIPNIPHESV